MIMASTREPSTGVCDNLIIIMKTIKVRLAASASRPAWREAGTFHADIEQLNATSMDGIPYSDNLTRN